MKALTPYMLTSVHQKNELKQKERLKTLIAFWVLLGKRVDKIGFIPYTTYGINPIL